METTANPRTTWKSFPSPIEGWRMGGIGLCYGNHLTESDSGRPRSNDEVVKMKY